MSADFLPTSGIDLASQPEFDVGPLRIRPAVREVKAGGETERLEPRVMQALVALAEEPGKVISREALLERCWDGRIVSDDAINRCMMKLRKVGAQHGAFSVEAIPRVGYRLVVTTGEAAPQAAPAPDLAAMRRRRWPALAAAAAAITVAVVAVVLWRSAPEPLGIRTPFVVTEITTARADDGLKAFAATTAGDIEAALSRYRLPTRPASTRFEIRGDVTSEAGRTRARLSIVALPSSTLIWTDQFDAPAEGEAGLRARIASRVASASDIVSELVERPSRDFDAMTLAALVKGIDGIANNTWDSRTGPEEAVRRSPLSAVAHANFGAGLLVASWYTPPDKAEPLRQSAIAELKRARELDPLTAEAAQWQLLLRDARDWAANLKITSEPPLAESHYGKMARGILLTSAGRIDEGMLPLADSMERLGERPGRLNSMIFAIRAAGKDSNALERTRKAIAILPSDYTLRSILLDLVALWAEPEETLAILDDYNQRPAYPTTWFEAYRRFALWRQDKTAPNRAAAIDAIAAATRSGMPPDSAVPMLVRLDDLDAAFKSTEFLTDPRRLALGPPSYLTFLYYTDTAPMRRDPRFIALADKLGLLDFWREGKAWPDFCRKEPDSVCAQMQAP
jgi:DNA-binding winged helix-turn-helix (wHTH) protein